MKLFRSDKRLIRSSDLKRLIRSQQSYIVIAVAIYAALWAVDRPAQLSSTLIYTLPLCNLIVLVQTHLGFLYDRRRTLRSWAIYVSLVFVVAILGVGIVNAIQYPMHKLPGQTLWQFLRTGWKLPFMATMIVGVSTQLYRRTRERLESKNRELQHTIEVEAVQRQMHGQQLQQAREIQQALLPKNIPRIAGFEIEGAWEPAQVVGGDYFDVIRLGDSKLGICIADVVGKSISAALLMANVQASVRAFAAESTSPSTLCSRVNSVLCSSIGIGKFVTFFYGVLDAERYTFCYTNAGHLPPILLRPDGEVQELKHNDAVLGVFAGWKYQDSEACLEPGDRLLLFTDGITEAGLPEHEEFGEQRLIASARRCARMSSVEFKSSVLADVKQFCAGQLRDDATFIVVSVLPSTELADRCLEPLAVACTHEG